jgi:hypothetical protein
MKWQKLGLIYCPSGTSRHPKLLSHAANPLPVLIEGDIYRVFFSSRDTHKRSSIGAVDIDLVKRKVIKEYDVPFFEHGPEGSFYADGVSIGNCYEVNGVKYMLFMGWQNPKEGHWRGDIGRLIVMPDLTLELESIVPFMASDSVDPISLSYPWVVKDESGSFSMWYGTTLTWDAGNGEMLHTINFATSNDGHQWQKQGLAIPYQIGVAQAFSRPTVLVNEDSYHMWFSYRGGDNQKYRIGHAHKELKKAEDLLWKLDLNNAGLDVSETGWDSEMIEYPFVLEHKKQTYMFYNGNGYGLSGFGLAMLKS